MLGSSIFTLRRPRPLRWNAERANLRNSPNLVELEAVPLGSSTAVDERGRILRHIRLSGKEAVVFQPECGLNHLQRRTCDSLLSLQVNLQPLPVVALGRQPRRRRLFQPRSRRRPHAAVPLRHRGSGELGVRNNTGLQTQFSVTAWKQRGGQSEADGRRLPAPLTAHAHGRKSSPLVLKVKRLLDQDPLRRKTRTQM